MKAPTHFAAFASEALCAAPAEAIALNPSAATTERDTGDFMILLSLNDHSKKLRACNIYIVRR